MKRLICLSSLFVAIVSGLLCVQVAQNGQYNNPLGTNVSFDLGIGNANTSKEDLIGQLSEIADHYQTIIVKPTTDAEHHDTERNIVYFSTKQLSFKDLSPQINEEGSIKWLIGDMAGKLYSPDQIGDTPLSGTYYAKYVPGLQEELQQWADSQNLQLVYHQQKSFVVSLYETVVRSGLFFAWVSANLLTLALVLSWIFLRHKIRAIQLIGGISVAQIHRETVAKTALPGLLGYLVGALLLLGYLVFKYGPGSLIILASNILLLVFLSFLLLVVSALVFSKILKPSPSVIAFRTLPLKKYYLSNNIVRGLSILVAALVLPSALVFSHAAFTSYSQSEDMRRLGDLSAVSIKDFDYLDTEEGNRNADAFFADPHIYENMAICINIGTAIELSADQLGGYGEIDVTDQHYLDNTGLDIQTLNPLSVNQLSGPLQELLSAQLEIWLKPGVSASNIVRLYSLPSNTDSSFISLGQNAAYGGELAHASNPLLVVIDDPGKNMKSSGFLLPLMSTGNIVFTDLQQVEQGLQQYGLYTSVLSVDRIADSSLATGQLFWGQFCLYLLAAVLIILTVTVSAWQCAGIWTTANRKRIFILHSSGLDIRSSYRNAMRKDLLFVVPFYIVGMLASLATPRQGGIVYQGLSFVIVIGVFMAVLMISYHISSRQEFRRTIQRGV